MQRGTAEFSLKDVLNEMEEKDGEKVDYGVLRDVGDKVIEE